MTERQRYVVIPTHSRPGDFEDCARAIAPQVDLICVIAHGGTAESYVWATLEKLSEEGLLPGCQVIPYQAHPPNISAMWNLGLDSMPYVAGGRSYDVAVINDDVICPPDWFERVTARMQAFQHRKGGASAGCVRRPQDHRMTGYAFILNGDDRLRADEQFQWWYGDDDLQRQADALGGVAFAEGRDVEHRHPNSTTTGILAEIAAQDADRYLAKWRGR